MTEPCHITIGSNSDSYTEDDVFFHNLNQSAKNLKSHLDLVIAMISSRFEAIYKSSAEIKFEGVGASKDLLDQWMQPDDLCMKFVHVESGLFVFATLNVKMARTLLMRLLASSLIDDSHGLLLSSTEKGLFAFVVTRLLFDLKNTLNDAMPNLKLVGIFQRHEDIISQVSTKGFGLYNFSFAFDKEIFPVIIAASKKAFSPVIKKHPKYTALLFRSGHIKRPMITRVKLLTLTRDTFENLAFGDLILFDDCSLDLKNNHLCGTVYAHWDAISLKGKLIQDGNNYKLLIIDSKKRVNEEKNMEELEIKGADKQLPLKIEGENTSALLDIAKSIRVPLSIELSRSPMTLAEISRLKEGDIIDLYRRIDDPLEMVVEGKIIGYCQPVKIADRLGIRILRLEGVERTAN